MKHLTGSEKSLLLGDDAADTLLQYAAALARKGSADTVTLKAIGKDGDEVEATFLLDSGTNLLIETSRSTLPEPDNTDAVMRMREEMLRLESSAPIEPDDQHMPSHYDDLDL